MHKKGSEDKTPKIIAEEHMHKEQTKQQQQQQQQKLLEALQLVG